MSALKERIIGAVTVMSEADARKVWMVILNDIAPKDFSEIEEVEPDEDEKRILDAWAAGEPEYQPYMTQEQLIAELGLR